MRGIGRILILMLLGLSALLLVPEQWLSLDRWRGYGFNLDEEFQSYQVFWLEPGQHLSFDLPTNARQLRVMVTPHLPEADRVITLNYQLFDGSGRAVEQFQQALSNPATPPRYVAIEAGDGKTEAIPGRFFDKPAGIAAGETRYFVIDVKAKTPYSRVRIEMPEDNLQPLALRVSSLEERSANRAPIVWQRLHPHQLQKVVEGHIYPPPLVSDRERNEALRYEWRPVGPGGIEGIDYRTATLFSYTQLTDSIPEHTDEGGAQVQANAEDYISFFRSEMQPVHSLRCKPLNGQSLSWLGIRYQADTHDRVTELLLRGEQANRIWLLPPLDGLYEVKASSGCTLQLTDSKGIPIQLPLNRVPGHLMLPNERLRYPLAINSRTQQPLRVDLRQVDRSVDDTTNGLEWALLDADDEVLARGHVWLPSGNDPAEQLPGRKLALKQRLYITAPAAARYLELRRPTGTLLTTVFNRPLNLPLQLEIEGGRSQRAHQSSTPRWFPLAPVNREQLHDEGKSAMIHWHYRLDQVMTTNSTDLVWKEMRPVDQRGTFTLLTRTRPDSTVDNPAYIYHPLTGDNPLVHLKSGDSRRQIAPALVYRRTESSPRRVRIAIGHLPPQDHWLVGRSGRLQLPELPVGQHQIRIEGAGETQWLCNFQEKPDDPAYWLREVVPLGTGSQFSVDKVSGRLVVSLEYFPWNGVPHTIHVKLTDAKSNMLATGHSFRTRHFAINPGGQSVDGLLLDHQAVLTDDALSVVVSLADDLPAGSYVLSVTSSAGDSGFIRGGYYRDTRSTDEIEWGEGE